jgi:geranylgeranyl reductase
MYDVCIVGAGPSGATVARLLGGRYRVLLVDRRALHEPAGTGLRKACGGLLAPAAQRELACQGLGVPANVVVGPQLFAVRTVDAQTGLERCYQRFYVNVDRDAFDRWLVSRVPASTDRAFGWRFEGIEPDDVGWIARFATPGGGRASVRAGVLVGADGAGSLVRSRALPDAPAPSRYIGYQGVHEKIGCDPCYGALFDSATTDFYGWTIPKGDRTVVGVALPAGRGSAEDYDRFVERARASGFSFGTLRRREAAPIWRPTRPGHIVLGCDRVVLVGEAAGLISASSAEGISYALRSARALSDALQPGVEGVAARYARTALPLVARACARLAKADAIYAAPTRRLLMRTGLGAMRVAEDEALATPICATG